MSARTAIAGLSLLGACAAPAPRDAAWHVDIAHENAPPAGIWTVGAYPVLASHAMPALVALDDEGRCHVLTCYSGRWSRTTVAHDHEWLGGLEHADVDPRIDGAELYAGGKKGNLYQIVAHPHGAIDCRLIAHLPGREIHTIVADDGLLVFTRPGGLWRVTADGPDGRFETELVEELRGRVRDAVRLPGDEGWIATASRDGTVELVRMTPAGPERAPVFRDTVGKGRLALGSPLDDGRVVLYSGVDDGRVLRHVGTPGDAWDTESIYDGPQGVRGVAVGRFDESSDLESVAVFGYSSRVELLRPTPDGRWSAETIFVDRDKGHWLTIAELDGRNATDELVGSGYGGRVFVLSRPPGYGR